MSRNYQNSISLPTNPAYALKLITERVAEWWSADFDGEAGRVGDVFTVRFNTVFHTMRVIQLLPDSLVEWECIDQHLETHAGIQLENKREWVGNIIRWEVRREGQMTSLSITHFGLTPESEYWRIWGTDWNQLLANIRRLAITGKTRPFYRLEGGHLAKAKRTSRGGK